MKKTVVLGLAVVAAAPVMLAHSPSAIDALTIGETDLRGTARFMGMGGAFTALGGDLSTLTQNPAGIGIYRHSELGLTLDINMGKTQTTGYGMSYSDNNTKFNCNNFGYVGVANLGGEVMKQFSWGVTFNRTLDYERHYKGYCPQQAGSLSNYIAGFTTNAGYSESMLNFGENYNPYLDSNADWLSILAYNSFMINPVDGNGRYQGLYNNNTVADAEIDVREKAYIDEYSINFGGNISDMVYWGLGVGLTDMSYTRSAAYSESMENASAYTVSGVIDNANAGFWLDNYKHITGNGWKLDFGLIFKPVNELRIGAAVHTPTWWDIDHAYYAETDYSYNDPLLPESDDNPRKGSEMTDYAGFSWRLQSPWKFMLGVAGVIGNSAIVSIDYERQAYNDMSVRDAVYDSYGYNMGYENNEYVNEDIHNYTKAADIVRVGAEYRVTPQFSLRAGYNVKMSYIKDEAADGSIEVFTSGTDPSYEFNKTTQNISFGLGYSFGAFKIDLTYLNTKRDGKLHAYTNYAGFNGAPTWNTKQTNNSIVMSLAYRF